MLCFMGGHDLVSKFLFCSVYTDVVFYGGRDLVSKVLFRSVYTDVVVFCMSS